MALTNSKKHSIILFALIICLPTLYFSCERNTTPFTQSPAQLTVSAEYVAVTEAWLRVQTKNISGEPRLTVWRDTTMVFNGILNKIDTTVYDSTLFPAQDYAYYAAIIRNSIVLVASNPLKVTTMDTTSHDFQWDINEIPSPYGSGVLHDVTIVNENDIWAVGEIYADSIQPWLPYNAVHWDGQEWELKRINFYLCPNGTTPTPYPIKAVFAFSGDDIWFTRGGSIVHWNGTNFIHDCQINSVIDGSINKLWGTNSNNLYAVGYNGTIVHFNGSNWEKIESGTDLPIMDIYGVRKNKSGQYEILCVAEEYGNLGGSKILSIESSNVIEISTNGLLSSGLWGIWFVPQRQYIAVGDGLWETHSLGGSWVRSESLPALFKTSIDGKDLNDVVIVGAFWLLAHYNGINWRTYFPVTSGSFTSVAMKDDVLIAVGGTGNQPVAAIGRRL